MTTRASTGTTAASESPEVRLGDDVHFVQTNGTSCMAAKVSALEYLNPADYTDAGLAAYQLDKELAYVNLTVFHPTNQPFCISRAAHSPLPTAGTYHTREECRRGN